MRVRFFKWSIIIQPPRIMLNEELDHYCLNQIMDGDYECKWCNK